MSDRGELDPFRDREIVDMYNAGAVAGVRNAAAPGDHRGVANGVMAASEAVSYSMGLPYAHQPQQQYHPSMHQQQFMQPQFQQQANGHGEFASAPQAFYTYQPYHHYSYAGCVRRAPRRRPPEPCALPRRPRAG